jgi:hypothetical protein
MLPESSPLLVLLLGVGLYLEPFYGAGHEMLLKTFSDGQTLNFDQGRFDNFRVSFYDEKGTFFFSPKDVHFLSFFLSLENNTKTWEIIYQSFRSIRSDSHFHEIIIPTIIGGLKEKKMLSSYAAALLAEERKERTVLGKLVKFIALHQTLMQGWEPIKASKWSYGLKANKISRECQKFNISRY